MKINLGECTAEAGNQLRLLIIIPAYNEERNLQHLLHQLQDIDMPIATDVLIVNDGSTDGTGAVLGSEGDMHTTNLFNMGYGSCLQIGYKYALRRNYSYVIQMDADGQHDVSNIPIIYRELVTRSADGSYPDIVLGSRFMKESSPFQVGWLKKIAFGWFRYLLKGITGYREKIYDPTTGLQGLSRTAFAFYSTYGSFDTRFPDANMLAQMILLGFRIRQIPACMHQRAEGKSMHTGLIRQGGYMIHMTLSILAVGIRQKTSRQDQMLLHEIRERYPLPSEDQIEAAR
ncbi:MAG: glycosyltransferase family 2 protein [Bilifractor sp.]